MASKMYILIKDSVDLGHAINAAAHASLGGYLTFINTPISPDSFLAIKDTFSHNLINLRTNEWATNSFKKVVCKVTQSEFEKAKTYGKNMVDYRIMTESSLNNEEVAIVFAPKEEWENFFKFLKLYR